MDERIWVVPTVDDQTGKKRTVPNVAAGNNVFYSPDGSWTVLTPYVARRLRDGSLKQGDGPEAAGEDEPKRGKRKTKDAED
jgi:hypothetical protein